ncbi:hypothetical protein KRX51_01265 [Corynebacterium sp. TAE3-ERU12]|uniref:hypothetical protein n=1 Tax=Corynebacterium sp. TAE3-ERU12 TaxID=2849491 RepID=UPI001C446601|nr:hypothetical protein [Corynebacterium sp. TAE3-ERU12]MBV7294548.1 hypothetical protein [Corynebacterium sp. TAE3-ERU12]
MTKPPQAHSPARPSWYWLLMIGALAQVAVGAALLTLDRSSAPARTAQDILIVGIVGLIVGFVIVAAIPNADTTKARRMVILTALAVVIVVTAFGMITRAVQPWAAVPFVLMTMGSVTLYNYMRSPYRN